MVIASRHPVVVRLVQEIVHQAESLVAAHHLESHPAEGIGNSEGGLLEEEKEDRQVVGRAFLVKVDRQDRGMEALAFLVRQALNLCQESDMKWWDGNETYGESYLAAVACRAYRTVVVGYL